MKRSIIIVSVFTLVFLVVISFIGINFLPVNQANTINFNNIEITLEYTVKYDYCKFHHEVQPYISIDVIGGKVHFKQVYYIYCNANDDIFWLELVGNNSVISILEVFEPINSVARCVCPIMISGVLGDFDGQLFTLEFIEVNNYVYQNRTLESFPINT